MLKGTCVIFSRITNGEEFTDKCLKQIAKDNKKMAYKIGDGTGIVRNFRYSKGNVIADFIFPYLTINTSGVIESKLDLPNKENGVVNKFTIKTIELVQNNYNSNKTKNVPGGDKLKHPIKKTIRIEKGK